MGDVPPFLVRRHILTPSRVANMHVAIVQDVWSAISKAAEAKVLLLSAAFGDLWSAVLER